MVFLPMLFVAITHSFEQYPLYREFFHIYHNRVICSSHKHGTYNILLENTKHHHLNKPYEQNKMQLTV